MSALEESASPMTVDELERATGYPNDAIYDAIDFLEKKGIIERPLRNWDRGKIVTYVIPERAIEEAIRSKFPEISRSQLDRAIGLAEAHKLKHQQYRKSIGLSGDVPGGFNEYGDARLWSMKGRSIQLAEIGESDDVGNYLNDLDSATPEPETQAAPEPETQVAPEPETQAAPASDSEAMKDLMREIWQDDKPKPKRAGMKTDKSGQGLLLPEMKKEIDQGIDASRMMRPWLDAIEEQTDAGTAVDAKPELKKIALKLVTDPPKAQRLDDKAEKEMREVLDGEPTPEMLYEAAEDTGEIYLEELYSVAPELDDDVFDIIEETLAETIDDAIRKDLKKKTSPKRAGTKLKQRAESASEKAKQSRKDLYDAVKQLRSKPTVGLDLEVAALAVRAAKDTIEAGVLNFAAFVETVATEVPSDLMETLGPYLEAAWNRAGEIGYEVDEPTSWRDHAKASESQQAEPDYGTAESPNRVALGIYFQEQLEAGKRYTSIIQARSEASELVGGKIEPGTPAVKAVDEAIEQGVVRAARSFVEQGTDKLDTYDKLRDLYARQPRLAVRTGTSMRQQAYSTPAPLAWAASIFADVEPGDAVYDSSAGNGMLLIGADLQNAMANELNPDRAEGLREIGYSVNEGDATSYTPEQQPAKVIINPPFGKLDGQSWTVDGLKTEEIDHAIVLQTLDSMQDDGKAVLIIGAKGFEKRQPKDDVRRGQAYANQKAFYDRLYDRYNVTDHFTVHGDLYSKQGAAFPVDVIVIDGKGASTLAKPYQIDRTNAVPRVLDNWEKLRDVAKLHLDTGSGRTSDLANEANDGDLAGFSGLLEGQGSAASGSRPQSSGNTTGSNAPISGRGSSNQQSPRDSGQPPVSGPPRPETRSEPGSISDESGEDGAGRGSDDAGGLGRPSSKPVEQDAETEFQVAYEKRSNADGVGTLVPRTQAAAVARALEKAEARYGSLDKFVADELGYEKSELSDYFSAEQIDALALNIARHKEGKAFVLGDQTGVGKGRVAAGMMVYAKRQGLVPVFLTQSPNLYADMYRDLEDIGRHTKENPFHALATNTLAGKDRVRLPDGSELSQKAKFSKQTIAEVARSVLSGQGPKARITIEVPFDKNGKPLGKTPTGKQRVRKVQEDREYDAIFTTYAQLQTRNGNLVERHNALLDMAENAFFILDESHNAGGTATTGSERGDSADDVMSAASLIRRMLDNAQGASFLSATYAKRSQVMDLYAKTGMSDSIEGGAEELIETLVRGGVPLQQVLSEMLVESGAYMRRERSFDGIKFDAEIEETGLKEAGEVADVFNAINDLDIVKNEVIKSKAFKKWLVSQGLGLGKDSATGARGMDSTEFSSILHNLVDQMLLSIKADATADAAIAAIERGESPVIAVSNTMGAALNNYLLENPASVGDEIDFRFNTMAERYLERSREIMLTDIDSEGRKTSRRVRLPDEVIGDEGVAAYNAAQELINDFAADIPASPIDHIRMRLTEAGYSVAEITGRNTKTVRYENGKIFLDQRPKEEVSTAGKVETVRRFNGGQLDAMILNQSGSTGLSAHASDKFVNQRRRHMIIAQADKNIDTFMQMLGRIHRTGQVAQHKGQPKGSNLPRYTLLMSNVPAETRPAAVLVKKLASLNANVTADSKGSVSFDAPDLLNVVGDRIVAEYLAENPQLNNKLATGGIVEVRADGSPKVVNGIARKASGRMAMRPIDEQKAFWETVGPAFQDEIAQLDKLGKNPLKAAKVDLAARLIERVEIFSGNEEADSPFQQPAYADRVRVKKQGEPYSPEEVTEAIGEFYGKQDVTMVDVHEWASEQSQKVDSATEAAVERRTRRMVSEIAIAETQQAALRTAEQIKAKLRSFAPGKVVQVTEHGDDAGSVTGVVVALQAKEGKEHTPSGWSALISLASPDRTFRAPLSRLGATSENPRPGEITVFPQQMMINDGVLAEWTESTDVYEDRVIGTGNVLAAFDRLAGQDATAVGSIVFFTDDQGVQSRGVLMPRSFSLAEWQSQRPVVFDDAARTLEFLSRSPDYQVNSPDFAIQLMMDGSTLVARSPRSRQRSGAYTTNADIIAASNSDFVTVGPVAQLKVKGARRQKAVVEAILQVGPLTAGTNKEIARQIAEGGDATSSGGEDVRRMTSSGNAQSNQAGQTQSAQSPKKKPVSQADIVTTWSRLFRVPIRQGGYRYTLKNGTTDGIYKHLAEIVRLREGKAFDIITASHEIGHHVDKRMQLEARLKALKNENRSLYYKVKSQLQAMDIDPSKGRVFEGIAEAFREILTGTAVNASRGPDAVKWVRDTVAEHPVFGPAMIEAIKQAKQYQDQGAIQRAQSIFGGAPSDLDWKASTKVRLMREMDEWYASFVDDAHIVKRFSDVIVQNRGESDQATPYELLMSFRGTAGARAARAIADGVTSIKNPGERLGPSLATALEQLESDEEYIEAQAYAVARHGLTLAPDYNFGMDRDDAQAFVDHIEADDDKAHRYLAFAQGITDYNNSLVLMALDAGRITSEDATRMLVAHGETYVPLLRESDKQPTFFRRLGSRRGGGSLVELPRAFRNRSRQGSGRPVKDLVHSSIQRTVMMIDQAMKQQIHEAMVDQADPSQGGAEGLGGWFDKIDPKTIKHEGTVDEILSGLVEEGFIDEQSARIARAARDYRETGEFPADLMEVLADRYEIDLDAMDESDAADLIGQNLENEPDVEATISLYRADYRRPNGKHVIKVVRNGKPTLYEVDGQLYDHLDVSPQQAHGPILRMLAAGNRAFKLGATGVNTAFAMMNLFGDAQTYAVNSKRKGAIERLTKALEWAGKYTGSVLRLKENELVQLYREWGGDMFSAVGVDRKDVQNTRRKMMRLGVKKRISERPADVAKILLDGVKGAGDMVRTFVSFTDVGPRIAEAEFVLNEHGYEMKDGKVFNTNTGKFEHPSRDVMVKAMLAAGDVTYNYRRSGTKTRQIELAIPFTNAAVQSLDKTLRVYKGMTAAKTDAIARRQLLSLSVITGIAVAAKLISGDDDDELPEWLRYGYFTHRLGDEADATTLRLRMSREHSWLGNMILGGIDLILNGDDDTTSITKAMKYEARSKVPMPGGAGTVGVAGELLANYSMFLDRPIEPSYLADRRKDDRFDERTLGTSKLVAKGVNKVLPRSAEISPLQFEYVASGLTGGMYHRLLDTGERIATEGVGGLDARDVPALRGFVYDGMPQQSVYDFYDRMDEIKQDAGSGMPGAGETLGKMREYEAMMKLLRDLKGEDYDPRPNIVALAREALDRKEHSRYPHPLYTEIPPAAKAVLLDHARNEARRVGESLRMPMAQGEKETKEEFQKRSDDYEKRRAGALEWLKMHRDSPIVKEAVGIVRQSPSYQELRSGRSKQPSWSPERGESYSKHAAEKRRMGRKRQAATLLDQL